VMPPTWIDRAEVFEQVLARAAQHGRNRMRRTPKSAIS
jgi:hypothetical protein